MKLKNNDYVVKKIDKAKTQEKWKPILDALNISDDKKDWLSEYAELHSNQQDLTIASLGATGNTWNDTSNLLPVSMKVAAQTIGLDLVAVKPMGYGPRKSKKQQQKEDRINKLRKLEGKDPDVVLPNDEEGPIITIINMDFVYGNGNNKYITKKPSKKRKKK